MQKSLHLKGIVLAVPVLVLAIFAAIFLFHSTEPTMEQFQTFGSKFLKVFKSDPPLPADMKRETSNESVSYDKIKSDSIVHPVQWTLRYNAFTSTSITNSENAPLNEVLDIKFFFWWNGTRWEGLSAVSTHGGWSASDVDSLAVKAQ